MRSGYACWSAQLNRDRRSQVPGDRELTVYSLPQYWLTDRPQENAVRTNPGLSEMFFSKRLQHLRMGDLRLCVSLLRTRHR